MFKEKHASASEGKGSSGKGARVEAMICSWGSRKCCPKGLTWRADPLLVPDLRDIRSPAGSHDSWCAAFCWCSSHERWAETHAEHSRLLAHIWRWNGVSVKDTPVLGQEKRMGWWRGRQLLVLLCLAPCNCSVWRCNEENRRNQEKPSIKPGERG